MTSQLAATSVMDIVEKLTAGGYEAGNNKMVVFAVLVREDALSVHATNFSSSMASGTTSRCARPWISHING